MHIVLLQPPIQDFYDTDVRLQPIGHRNERIALGHGQGAPGQEVILQINNDQTVH